MRGPCLLPGLLLGLMLTLPAWANPPPALAVVVAATRAAEPLEVDDLSLVYKRKKQFWHDGRRILPVNLPPDHALRRLFAREVLKLSLEAQEDYWNEQYFQGVLPPHMLRSEEAVARFVAETEGAVGYLSPCALDPRLRIVLLLDAGGGRLDPSRPTGCAAPARD